jgi:hypothetical protein
VQPEHRCQGHIAAERSRAAPVTSGPLSRPKTPTWNPVESGSGSGNGHTPLRSHTLIIAREPVSITASLR